MGQTPRRSCAQRLWEFEPTVLGRIGIESKQDMRSRGVSSPDIADALMLAFFEREELYPKDMVIPDMSQPGPWQFPGEDWDDGWRRID